MSNHREKSDCDVVIVGAGLAGLTAAWSLKKRGLSVRVLEAASHVGGRIARGRLGNHDVDRGAQFWTTAYRTIPALVQELGLAPQISYVSPETAILIDGRLHVVSSTRPWSVFCSGLLSFSDSMGLATDSFAAAWRDRGRDASVTDPWVEYDTPFEASPMRNSIRDRLIDPMLNSFYFHGTDTSAALVLAMTALGRRGRLFCLKGGLGQLTERLAAEVDVQLDTKVDAVVSGPNGVRVKMGQITWHAKHVILCVPATVAREIYADATDLERLLLGTRYTAGASLTLVCAAHWRLPEQLERVYGVIVPGASSVPFAALTFEKNKSNPLTGQHQINVLINAANCGALLSRNDADVMRVIIESLAPFLPDIAQAIECGELQRWLEAMPCTPVGRVTAVRDYWCSIPFDRRVWLAGDYMGFPWSDAAAASGERAAGAIAARIR